MSSEETKSEVVNELLIEYRVDNPDELNGEQPKYTGIIKFKLPGYIERLKLLRAINYKIDSTNVTGNDTWDIGIKLAEEAMKHIVEVNVTRVMDGHVINSLDMLQYDGDASAFISKIGNKLTSGVSMGKN